MNRSDSSSIAKRSTTLWSAGASAPATMLWVTESHAEIIVEEGTFLSADALVAVVLREFLSMPMRVVAQIGQNVVLYFVQKPHESVLELIDQDLIKAGIAQLRDTLEERAIPNNLVADIEDWQAQANHDDMEAAKSFNDSVRGLAAYCDLKPEPRERVAA